MNFSGEYITADELAAMVAAAIDDTDMRKMPKGFYIMYAQEALQELSIQTFFNVKREVMPVPADGAFDLPENMFSPKEIYVFNGAECNDQTRHKLWHKRNFYHKNNGSGFAINRGVNGGDPFAANTLRSLPHRGDGNLFYNTEGGRVMLSPACQSYTSLMIVAYSLLCPFNEAPIIPVTIRQTCFDFVATKACLFLMPRDPSIYAGLHQTYSRMLDYEGLNGSWHRGKRFMRRSDSGAVNDFKEYLSRWSYTAAQM